MRAVATALTQTVTAGTWILLASLLLALAFGGWRAWADGRFRGTHPVHGVDPEVELSAGGASSSGPDPLLPADQLGDRATLLQFSSAFCAPCRATRRVLGEVAETVPGVTHVEIDAEHHLDLVRRLGVLRTPTTLVLDPRGTEVSRAAGAPRRDEVLATLARLLDG